MEISVCLVGMGLMLSWFVNAANAEMASVYGGRDGPCGSRTANGERVNCSAMTAAHRRLPFGRGFASVIEDASQFESTIAAPLCGVGILIYPRRRPELSVWVALGMSLFRDCRLGGNRGGA